MKFNNSCLKTIIASIFIPFILIIVVFTLPVSAFVKKPWNDLRVDYLKEVVSSNPGYFDGDWTGTLKCKPVENSQGFTKYLKFRIKNGRGRYKSSGTDSKQAGYRYWELKISESGKTTIKGDYDADSNIEINFSGQIGIDPVSYFREIMWIEGSRGPRICEGKLDREVPLITIQTLSDRVPMCADYLRKMKEEPDSEDLLNIGIEGEKYKNQLKEELKAEIIEQLEVEIEKRTIVHSAKIDSDTQTNYQENNAENSDVLYVSLVKDAILYNYPEKTIGEAINETLSTVQWKVSKGRNGTIYVSAQGEIINDVLYFGEQYHAMIQFKVNRNLAPYVGINTVQINSEPVSDNMLTEVLEFFFNQEAYIQHYKLRAACVKFEVEAQSASAAISDYFSEPDRIKVPTVEELKVASQYNPTYPVEIIGNTYENISILVIDSNNSCSSGIAYIYSFENGGKWIN